jgi:hypothetical protein
MLLIAIAVGGCPIRHTHPAAFDSIGLCDAFQKASF